jgi:hypothetical protein
MRRVVFWKKTTGIHVLIAAIRRAMFFTTNASAK